MLWGRVVFSPVKLSCGCGVSHDERRRRYGRIVQGQAGVRPVCDEPVLYRQLFLHAPLRAIRGPIELERILPGHDHLAFDVEYNMMGSAACRMCVGVLVE